MNIKLQFIFFVWLSLNHGHTFFNMGTTVGLKVKEDDIVGVIYFASNDPNGNNIIINSIQVNGELKFKKAISTGGIGSSGSPEHSLDPLQSAKSLLIVKNNLFVVNAGSNSISMFSINPKYPTRLKLVDVVSSEGDFPVTLDYSIKFQMLCVGNTGIKNCIQCFSILSKRLVPLPKTGHSLGLDITKIPPPGYLGVSDILFTGDSKYLLVSIRANTTNTNGYIYSFPVHRKKLDNPIINIVTSSAFQMILLPKEFTGNTNSILYTDIDYGFSIIKIASDGKITDSIKVIIAGPKGACWEAISPRSKTVFIIQAYDVINEVSIHTNNININTSIQQIKQYNVSGYPIDTVIVSLPKKDYLYVLTPREIALKVMLLESPGNAKIIQIYRPIVKIDEVVIPLTKSIKGIVVYMKNA